ncbi:MAG: hypothetical protein WC091_18120 [Sulfuricellaceae bacterium]
MTPHSPLPERLESPLFVALSAIHADSGGRKNARRTAGSAGPNHD